MWTIVGYIILAAFIAIIAIGFLFLYYITDHVPAVKISGSKIVITGGSDGLGLCIARKLVQKGANLVVIARSQEKLNKALAVLKTDAVNQVRTTIEGR
jgi:3-dehydrosphinganine reductase